MAYSSDAELTSMTSQSILPEVRESIPHWRCANTTGSHMLHLRKGINCFRILLLVNLST